LSRLRQRPFLAFPREEPASEPTEAGIILLRSRPYLVKAGGGAGGGAFSPQQAETPSVAAAKATKAKYFTMFISASIKGRLELETRLEKAA
jgi:hypothetical protein